MSFMDGPQDKKVKKLRNWYWTDWVMIFGVFWVLSILLLELRSFKQLLEPSLYMNLGGWVIPIQFMTSDWSYFEFSHQFILMVIVWVNSAKEMTLSRFCILIDFDFITDFFLLNKHFTCWGLYDIDRKNQNYGVIY